MPTEFKLPELGENVTAGDVVRVMVSAGDTIAKDQPLLELETDKATIEVPSTVSGTVRDIKIKQGEKVKVGQVVLTVDEGNGAGAAPAKTEAADAKPAEKEKKAPAAQSDEEGLTQAARGADTESSSGKGREAAAAKGQEERDRGAVSSEPDKTRDDDAGATERGESGRQKPRGEVVEISRGARPAQPQQAPEPEGEGPMPPARRGDPPRARKRPRRPHQPG
jgi:pyruvate/2-oxoglutarate dehydrogenase complex dihydrolipoamide acyltransferase (E2) component